MLVLRLLRRLPLKFTILAVIALCVVGEEYPFSPFPMYDSFEGRTYYVYVSDVMGRPLATEPVFAQRVSDVKKVFASRLDQAKAQMREAGHRDVKLGTLPPEKVSAAAVATLAWLKGTAVDPAAVDKLGGLQLHRVDLSLRDGRIAEKTSMVGELR
jgi:hypothetical protein